MNGSWLGRARTAIAGAIGVAILMGAPLPAQADQGKWWKPKEGDRKSEQSDRGGQDRGNRGGQRTWNRGDQGAWLLEEWAALLPAAAHRCGGRRGREGPRALVRGQPGRSNHEGDAATRALTAPTEPRRYGPERFLLRSHSSVYRCHARFPLCS